MRQIRFCTWNDEDLSDQYAQVDSPRSSSEAYQIGFWVARATENQCWCVAGVMLCIDPEDGPDIDKRSEVH